MHRRDEYHERLIEHLTLEREPRWTRFEAEVFIRNMGQFIISSEALYEAVTHIDEQDEFITAAREADKVFMPEQEVLERTDSANQDFIRHRFRDIG